MFLGIRCLEVYIHQNLNESIHAKRPDVCPGVIDSAGNSHS